MNAEKAMYVMLYKVAVVLHTSHQVVREADPYLVDGLPGRLPRRVAELNLALHRLEKFLDGYQVEETRHNKDYGEGNAWS